MNVNIKKLHADSVIPTYAKVGDAGMDLTATSKEIDKYGNTIYGIGLALEIPLGYVGLIFPRSSISKLNLDLANSVGVIDSGYRGELICKFKPTPHLKNYKGSRGKYNTDEYYELATNSYEVGDRVAQIMIIPIPEIGFTEVEELSETDRGEGGFGSTNI